MPVDPEFLYLYRWAQATEEGWDVAVDKLEARDQAIEDKLRTGWGGGCSVEFQFPYRWDQILREHVLTQSIMLEARDQAIETAINNTGGCRLEYPFRWNQFWEPLVAGETWAIGIAEEHDRALEMLLGLCSCGSGITTSADFSFDGGISEEYFFPFNGDLSDFQITALGVSTNGRWRINIFDSGFSLLTRFIVHMPTGGDIDATVNLNTLAITGTYPGDVAISTTGIGSPSVVAGDYFQFDVTSTSFTATSNPFALTAQFEGENAELFWFNPS